MHVEEGLMREVERLAGPRHSPRAGLPGHGQEDSTQRQRWAAGALLDIEPELRRIKGFRHLPLLRHALQVELNLGTTMRDRRRPPWAPRQFQLKMGLPLMTGRGMIEQGGIGYEILGKNNMGDWLYAICSRWYYPCPAG